MMTWAADGGVLFSCDAFGSFGALGDRVFDDEFSAEEHVFFESEALRYYANIISSFGLFVKKAIDKVAGLAIEVIAPSHGIVWRAAPLEIIDRYARYAEYLEGPREKEIAIVWGSMYGNTEKGLGAVIEGIESEGRALQHPQGSERRCLMGPGRRLQERGDSCRDAHLRIQDVSPHGLCPRYFRTQARLVPQSPQDRELRLDRRSKKRV